MKQRNGTQFKKPKIGIVNGSPSDVFLKQQKQFIKKGTKRFNSTQKSDNIHAAKSNNLTHCEST